MNARQANSVPIRSYLETKGIMPTKTTNSYSMYQAPYRNDSHASLKVSHRENLWIDFGTNEGGTLIDLVLKINHDKTVSEAIREIDQSTNLFFSFHQQKTLCRKGSNGEESRFGSWSAPDPKHDSINDSQKSQRHSADREKILSITCTDYIYHPPSNKCADTIQNLLDNMDAPNICGDSTEYISDKTATHNTVKSKKQNPIYNRGTINIDKLQELGNNPILTAYLNQRGIQVEIAKPYCKEVYYRVNQKKYFGIAHRNNKGWCIRNKYWKGCTAQGYSYYQNHQDTLLVFEGIFDMLSFMELQKLDKDNADLLILNSLVNIKKVMSILMQYTFIKLYLDHDEAGRKATHFIHQHFPIALDQSSFYKSYKDLNDYHLKKEKGKRIKEKG